MSPWVYREEPAFELPRWRPRWVWVSELDKLWDRIRNLESRVALLENKSTESKEEPKQ